MNEQRFRGSCLCGSVKFSIRPPFLFFHHCHCSRCRKSSGSAHRSNIFLKREQLEWLSGEVEVQRYELPEAQFYCTSWCAKCGSSMPWLTRNGKYYLVPAGALDDDPVARPERNIYWDSRAPWYTELTSLPTLPEGGSS